MTRWFEVMGKRTRFDCSDSPEWEEAAYRAVAIKAQDNPVLRVNGMFLDPNPPSRLHIWDNGGVRLLTLWRAVRDEIPDKTGKIEVTAIYYLG